MKESLNGKLLLINASIGIWVIPSFISSKLLACKEFAKVGGVKASDYRFMLWPNRLQPEKRMERVDIQRDQRNPS